MSGTFSDGSYSENYSESSYSDEDDGGWSDCGRRSRSRSGGEGDGGWSDCGRRSRSRGGGGRGSGDEGGWPPARGLLGEIDQLM